MARTTLVNPFALATSSGVRQSSFITKALAGNSNTAVIRLCKGQWKADRLYSSKSVNLNTLPAYLHVKEVT